MENQTVSFGKWQRIGWLAAVVGLAASAYGYKTNHAQFAQSYLLAFVYWFAFAGGSLALLMIHHLVSGRWGFVVQRPLEAAARTIPLFALLFIPIVLSMHDLYHWTHADAVEHDHLLQWKSRYLNSSGFLLRAGIFFVIWTFLAYTLSSWSNRLDTQEDAATVRRLRALAAPGMVVFALTMTFASFDWLMSLEPHWFSSIYGALFMVGQGLATFCLMAIMAYALGRREPIQKVITPRQYHDLGNFMFAFTILWTYMSFSQFIIIWSGNLPEETFWYMQRSNEEGRDWLSVSILLAVLNFFVPFILMLFKANKFNPGRLRLIALWILAVRALDYYWQIGPTFRTRAADLHWLDAATFVGVGGLFLAVFLGLLAKRPILIKHDPRFSAFAAGGSQGHH